MLSLPFLRLAHQAKALVRPPAVSFQDRTEATRLSTALSLAEVSVGSRWLHENRAA